MVITNQVSLPSEVELTVQEVEVSTAGLRAAAFHMGKACENVNNVGTESVNTVGRREKRLVKQHFELRLEY